MRDTALQVNYCETCCRGLNPGPERLSQEEPEYVWRVLSAWEQRYVELRRISLPRTPVNKWEEVGQRLLDPARYLLTA